MEVKEVKAKVSEGAAKGAEKANAMLKKLGDFLAPIILRLVVMNRQAIIADLQARAAKSDSKVDDYAVKGFEKVLEALEADGY